MDYLREKNIRQFIHKVRRCGRPGAPQPQPVLTLPGWVACVPRTPSLMLPLGAAMLAPTCPGLHPALGQP